MSIQEKRREGFEAWFQAEMLPRITGSQAIVRAMCEKGWNAALDSVVIELPKDVTNVTWPAYEQARDDILGAIESAGLKVKS